MTRTDWAARIAERIRAAGQQPAPGTTARLAAYLELLARWNRRLNLTGLPLEPPEDQTIDRLVVEPVLSASHIWSYDQIMMDIGSGGGSPAIPIKTSCPWLKVVLVESKSRKCAFLREAARALELPDVQVEECRFEELKARRPDLAGLADLVTFRALRADDALWDVTSWLLKPAGRIVWFGGTASGLPLGFQAQPFEAGVIGRRQEPASQ